MSDELDLGIEGLRDVRWIGAGGSAAVFSATRAAIGDRVAVKVLRSMLLDDDGAAHFDKERRALQQLARHPNIVAILDSGTTTQGEPYLVMPLFPFTAKEVVARNGGLPWEQAAAMVSAVADAVHLAHLDGVLHRDVKPANVLITDTGIPFISDFGIAQLADATLTSAEGPVLTPHYAAPELFRGEPASPQSDIYALGATFFCLVAGEPPFSVDADSGESPHALMLRILDSPAPSLAAHGVPPAVASAIDAALAKDPALRQATAADLAAAIRPEVTPPPVALDVSDDARAEADPSTPGSPTPATDTLHGDFAGPPASDATAPGTFQGATPQQGLTEAGTFIGAGAAASDHGAPSNEHTQAGDFAGAPPDEHTRDGDFAGAPSNEHTRDGDFAGARADGDTQAGDFAGVRPDEHTAAGEFAGARPLVDFNKVDPAIKPNRDRPTGRGQLRDGAPTPDAPPELVVTTPDGQQLHLPAPDAAPQRSTSRRPRPAGKAQRSRKRWVAPLGVIAIAAAFAAWWVVGRSDDRPQVDLPEIAAEFANFGETLQADNAGSGRIVAATSVASKAASGVYDGHTAAVQDAAVLLDGRVATVGGEGDSTVQVWDPARPDQEGVILSGATQGLLAVAVNLDNTVFAAGAAGTLWQWDVDNPDTPPIEYGQRGGAITDLALLIDGRIAASGPVISATGDSPILAWPLDAPGATPTQIGNHDAAVISIASFSDGRLLSGGEDGVMRLWNSNPQPTQSNLVAELVGHSSTVRAVAAVNATTVASADVNGDVLVWDLSNGGPEITPVTELRAAHDGGGRALTALDGDTFASAGNDLVVRLWAIDGTALGVFRGHSEPVNALVEANDRLVSVADDAIARVWNLEAAGEAPEGFGDGTQPYRAALRLADGRLALAQESGAITLWNPANTSEPDLVLDAHASSVVAMTEVGSSIISSAEDGTVVASDSATGELLGAHSDHGAEVTAMTTNGAVVVTGAVDGTIRSWTPGSDLSVPVAQHGSEITAVAILDDGRIASADAAGGVRLSNGDGSGVALELAGHSGRVQALVADGTALYTAGADPFVIRWNTDTASEQARLALDGERVSHLVVDADGGLVAATSTGRLLRWASADSEPTSTGRSESGVARLVVLNDGRIATGGGLGDPSIRVWSADGGDGEGTVVARHIGSITALETFGPDRLLSASEDGTALLIDVNPQSGTEITTAVASDGDAIYVGLTDGTVRTIDLQQPDGAAVIADHEAKITAIAVNGDGKVLSVGHDGALRVTNAETEQSTVLRGHDDWVRAVATGPSGQALTASWDGTARLWPLDGDADGEAIVLTSGGTALGSAVALQDGWVATGSLNGEVRLFSTSGTDSSVLLGSHGAPVTAMAPLSDGRVVSASADGFVSTWVPDASDGNFLVATHQGHQGAVLALTQLGDGTVISASDDGTIRRWPLASLDPGAGSAEVIVALDAEAFADVAEFREGLILATTGSGVLLIEVG